jgi:diguanylate cyclase (GGDEF)-like protein
VAADPRERMSANLTSKFGFDSPFARQLEDGFPWLRFSPELEPGFGEAHFQRTLPFVRGALYIGLALMILASAFTFLGGHPVDWLDNLVRFGLLAPVFVAAIIASHRPRYRRLFRILVLMTALTVGTGYVVLLLTGTAQTFQSGFAGLPVVIAFIYFALGLFMQTAMIIVLVLTVFYVFGALLTGIPADLVAHNMGILIVANFVCGIGSYMLEHALRSAYLEGQILAEMVEHDGLTGLFNRTAFDKYLGHVWNVGRRERKSIAVVMADIDQFKAYNDEHGHQAGDQCLQRVAGIVAAAARRPLDFAGRYGGEEFILVFYDSGTVGATRVAEMLRRNVEALRIAHRASPTAAAVTISIGVAVVEPWETTHSPAGVIQLADEALYQGKQHGGNRVTVVGIADSHLQTGVFRSG